MTKLIGDMSKPKSSKKYGKKRKLSDRETRPRVVTDLIRMPYLTQEAWKEYKKELKRMLEQIRLPSVEIQRNTSPNTANRGTS
jgi:ribosome recycling factor